MIAGEPGCEHQKSRKVGCGDDGVNSVGENQTSELPVSSRCGDWQTAARQRKTQQVETRDQEDKACTTHTDAYDMSHDSKVCRPGILRNAKELERSTAMTQVTKSVRFRSEPLENHRDYGEVADEETYGLGLFEGLNRGRQVDQSSSCSDHRKLAQIVSASAVESCHDSKHKHVVQQDVQRRPSPETVGTVQRGSAGEVESGSAVAAPGGVGRPIGAGVDTEGTLSSPSDRGGDQQECSQESPPPDLPDSAAWNVIDRQRDRGSVAYQRDVSCLRDHSRTPHRFCGLWNTCRKDVSGDDHGLCGLPQLGGEDQSGRRCFAQVEAFGTLGDLQRRTGIHGDDWQRKEARECQEDLQPEGRQEGGDKLRSRISDHGGDDGKDEGDGSRVKELKSQKSRKTRTGEEELTSSDWDAMSSVANTQ